ncbi:hypothetical protein DL764_006610 [Monosporascus ibericus]|uniref:Initiator tRNA phosphoribosyl transferase n=1 Tax=Monosporascus ibericus TaxID=155417 RepID=A0A4Q4T6N1_9PEZI|nr:hypothetical protein DL764_006610 [Monosporascus ibericus]
MDTLRSQLKEVQGHLADRDKKYRQLNHEYREARDQWAATKEDYETRIRKLEAENNLLRGGHGLTLTQAEKDEVENRFRKTTNELAAKTKQCEALQHQLRLLQNRTAPAQAVAQDIPEGHVVSLFTKLRERIRNASMKRFSESTDTSLIPQKSREELDQLSSKWESYMGSQMVGYLLRALIWRYVHSALFMKPGRIWGQDTRNMLRTLSGMMTPKVSDVEYQAWRMETGRLLHQSCEVDATVLDAVMKQIYEATKHFATGKNTEELKKSIGEIVMIGAELSDIFVRSHYEPLMSNKPGSGLTRGFPFQEETMEIKAKLGSQHVVDMMITPCLLKKDGDYSVLAKAEVVRQGPMGGASAAPAASAAAEEEEEEEEERELVFAPPQAKNHNFNSILQDLRRRNLSVGNRLRSIREDAAFVAEVAAAFGPGRPRPVVANERCGSWYVHPRSKAASAYFKSTDGHFGQWRFSARRLNLHLLDLVGERDGCVVVDSTRRGKRMPDALSKTVPIWCCVLNNALFPASPEREEGEGGGDGDADGDAGGRPLAFDIHVPPNVVSDSERAQMRARIPEHVALLRSLGLDLAALRRKLKKPLRPIWVTQESRLAPTAVVFEDYHPVICCTSSRRVVGAEMSEGGYIQGAGDDTEHWALGLTPPVFWEHADLLLSTPEPDLPDLVRSLVARHASSAAASAPKEIAPCLSVSALPMAEQPSSTCIVALHAKATDASSWRKSPVLMEVGIGKHKVASRNLRLALPHICTFVQQYLAERGSARLLIACESGKDLSVGVALALLCEFQDAEGSLGPRRERPDVNKGVIKVKLGSIMTRFPEANPSRATLQSVNSYLMG